ncbi:hypothetical protein RI844_09325 [Thalassotalea fonticola]|uniref:Uncharacterized protein n=1 Tax=Thalassotalea fonticola TaxID=3065649 RepID=A0ABZ0GUB4_9GAMM|nr:hypothetical protein RI844_09325 [Colwelliaceae bacterium S1-1]
MNETIREEVVEFEEHGLDIARIDSDSTSKLSTLSFSASPNIHIEKKLKINQPFVINVPNYGVKEIKLTRVDTFEVSVKVKNTPISPNIKFMKGVDNSPFPEQEKEIIRQKLESMEEEIKHNSELTQEIKDDLSEHVAYVKNSLEYLGRKDWFILAMGLLGNFASGAFYAPDVAIEMASSISTAIPQFLDSVVHAIPTINSSLARLNSDS